MIYGLETRTRQFRTWVSFLCFLRQTLSTASRRWRGDSRADRSTFERRLPRARVYACFQSLRVHAAESQTTMSPAFPNARLLRLVPAEKFLWRVPSFFAKSKRRGGAGIREMIKRRASKRGRGGVRPSEPVTRRHHPPPPSFEASSWARGDQHNGRRRRCLFSLRWLRSN